nr:tetratricopeptide repeat protein [Lachnospiraceae bacterium]
MNTSHLDRGRLAGGLLGATIIAGLLPRFLQALLLMMRKEGLPGYMAVLCEYFAMILVGCLLAYTLGGIKRAGKIMLFSGFWILFVSAVITMIGSLPLFRTDQMGIRIFWFCLSILRLLGMGFFAAVFVLHGLDRAEELSFSKRCKTAASLFLPIVILAAALGLTEALTGSLDASFVSGGTIPFSVSAYLTRALIVALLDFALLFFPVLFLVRSAEKKLDKRNEKTESADAEPSAETESTAPARTSPLIAVIPLVGILASVIMLRLFAPSSSDKILAGINTYTDQAALLYAMGDYTGTMKNIENLDGVLRAWNSALAEGDLQELEKIVQEYPSNEQIRFLYADALLRQDPEKAVSRLKQEILRNPYERAWVFAYLKSLKEAEKASDQYELSEAEQAFRDETILTLITSDLYVDDNLYLSGLSSRKQQKLKEQLDPSMMDGIKEDFLAADLEMERIQSGYSTVETLDKWLEIAERYPESFTAQGFALSTGYGYLTANETMEKKSNGEAVLSEEETHSLGSVIDRYDAMFQTMVLEADLSEEDKAQTIVDEKYD